MKKIYALLTATVLTGFAGFGQVEIRALESGAPVGNDISGTTVMISVTQDGTVTRNFSVMNVSGNGENLKIKRLRITEVAGWTDGVCWGPDPDPSFVGQCYPASSMTTNPWTTPNTASMPDQGRGTIVMDVETSGPGTGHYRYYVMNGNMAEDSIDVEISSTLGIEAPQQETVGMTAYPNPANNVLSINTTGLDGSYSLRITDVLGKVVYNEEIGAAKKVDVSDFKNGVYLVTVYNNGSFVQTRRVVVKHQ